MPDLDKASRRLRPPVRLTLPASVANDLGRLQETLMEAAARMGHDQCMSGCDRLYLDTEREFIVRERLQPAAHGAIESFVAESRIDVFVPHGVTDDIEELKRAAAIVADKVGCPGCHSGRNVTFRDEREMIAISESEVRGSVR